MPRMWFRKLEVIDGVWLADVAINATPRTICEGSQAFTSETERCRRESDILENWLVYRRQHLLLDRADPVPLFHEHA